MALKLIELQECQQILLQIAKNFDQICRKHQIPYFMLGGTMLGAIRHHGFIPWDDDMDFGIPRPFYQTFINVAKKELPTEYSILTKENSPSLKKGFIKIQLKGTKVIEKIFDESDKTFYNGICIDIFPLDGCQNNSWFDRLRVKINFLLIRIQEGRFCSLSIRSGIKKHIAQLIKLLPINDNKLSNLINKRIQYWNYNSTSQIANYYGHWKEKEIMNNEIFGTPKLYSFNDLTFYGVEDYDKYLHYLYGEYNVIPPKEMQITHANEIYVEEKQYPL